MSASQTDFSFVYNELTESLGLPEATLDSSGENTLVFKKDIPVTIHFNETDDEVLVYTVVTDLEPIENRYILLQNMMRANYFWMATEGFTLAVDKDSLRVLLMGREHSGYFTDKDILEHYLRTFAEIAWNWRELSKAASLPDIPIPFPASADSSDEDVTDEEDESAL